MKRAIQIVCVAGMVLACGTPAQTGYVEVFGGPTYDPNTQTGFKDATMPAAGAWPTVAASCVNDAGTAVGNANKYVAGSNLGGRAVRWDGGGTVATELGNLGTSDSGYTYAGAYAVNDANTPVGWTRKYVAGSWLGQRAVRWDAGGTAATELDNLGTDSDGWTNALAYAVNEANTVVGKARKYDDGSWLGDRPVRWDAGGTAATELGNLGTDTDGWTHTWAYAVNDANTAVGYAEKYVAGSYLGDRAVMWGPDAVAVDLNTLIDPAAGWTLTRACDISEHDLWIGGEGLYDPDGPGPLGTYERLWVMQVPEPATLSLLALGGLALVRRRLAGS